MNSWLLSLWPLILLIGLGIAITRLRNQYVGCAFALLGAILAGGLALGVGWFYVRHYYTAPRPRNDSDWSGAAVPLLCMVLLPGVSALIGFALGIGFAYWRERPAQAFPPKKPLSPHP